MQNLKEDVDIYIMYGKESSMSKLEFIKEYQINENRIIK